MRSPRFLALALSLAALGGCAKKPETQHAHATVHHSFGDADRWAQVFDAPDRDQWQRPDEVIALLELAQGQTVADIGAGTGYFLPYLSRAVGAQGRVLALDTEMSMVRYMTARAERESLGNVEARHVDPVDPKLPLGSVDRILIVDTWHHIEAREAYVAKLKQGLAPAGVVLVVDFTLESEKGPPEEMKIKAEQVKAELMAGGLTAEIMTETLPEQYVVRGRRP